MFSYEQGERFAEVFNSWNVEYLFIDERFPIASLDDLIAGRRAENRRKDRASLPRLEAFRDYLRKHNRNALSGNPA
ncbi:hypothetical protein HUU05_30175 [candidate division KSB1 bacterium]|nr:hypothetical protein [candidate division KSB1 bacterium]